MKNLSQIYRIQQEEKVLSEAPKEKSAVLTFGRFQPPTIGHEKLVDAVVSASKKLRADAFIFPSRTQDTKKNPLSAKDKIAFMRKSFKRVNIVDSEKINTVFVAVSELQKQGYTNITLVVGGDRVDEFKRVTTPYLNHADPKKSMNIDPAKFNVISAGERDPDATDVSGMSASKMRDAVSENDFDSFITGVPSGLGKADTKKLFMLLKKEMGIKEELQLQTEQTKDWTDRKLKKDEQKNDMRVVVFSGYSEKNPGNYMRTAGRVKEECEKIKVECFVAFVPYAHTLKNKNGTRTIINKDGSEFIANRHNTVIVVRGAASGNSGTLDIISSFERDGFFVINPRDSIDICSDKYRCAVTMGEAGVPTPRTALITNPDRIIEIHKKVGGKYPVVVKTIRGSKGKGVFILDSEKSLRSTIDAIAKIDDKQELIIQEYIPIKSDMRVIVLGGRFIAAMERTVVKKDFRSNFSLGGSIKGIKISDEIKDIAIKAAKVADCYYAGVDIAVAQDTEKPYVIEINSSPGSEGIEKASARNITKIFVDYIINKKNWKYPPTVVGRREMVDIEGIGSIEAKFDTGNMVVNSLHADFYDIKGDTVIWKIGNKTYKNKVVDNVTVLQGAIAAVREQRPIIELDIDFLGKKYPKRRFTLDNRSNKGTKVLIGVPFMKEYHIIVDPAKKFMKTTKVDEQNEQYIKSGIEFLSRYSVTKDALGTPTTKNTPFDDVNKIANDFFGI